ncbi:Protein sds23 [Penicillium subrubescens]|uniref:Protein sds23 n=1 Tax=Penicillium subrubescens TaxID=1316194 RepID=A0A1Q5T0X8_9EURO|nr:Protein sds23 [Penicillium subrubescens]
MADSQLRREGSDTSLNASADPTNGSGVTSPRSSTDNRSSRNQNQLRVSHMPPANHQHRQSLSETLRGPPGSPRNRRQPSLTQSAIQSLIDNPPPPKTVDSAFIGRDWREICIGELVSPEDLQFVELDTGVEEATNILIDTGAPVLLIRESAQHNAAVATFDYSDLNTYLLLAAGLTTPQEGHRTSYDELAKKARDGEKIPLKDVKALGMEKEPLVTLPASANVLTAVETFGGGIHRVVVTKEPNNQEVVGIFSQFRLVKFLWENGRSFPAIEQLYPQALNNLRIGSHNVISINGDKPLSEGLQLMNTEGVSSLVVVDNHWNVIGNISTTDVKSPGPATPHLPTPPQPYGVGNTVPFPPVASSGVTPSLASSIPASALPGARLSGRLVGVVSLTDILNLHARASGLSPADPAESRRRRRSSSSSMSVRRSGEIGRELFSRGGV